MDIPGNNSTIDSGIKEILEGRLPSYIYPRHEPLQYYERGVLVPIECNDGEHVIVLPPTLGASLPLDLLNESTVAIVALLAGGAINELFFHGYVPKLAACGLVYYWDEIVEKSGQNALAADHQWYIIKKRQAWQKGA